MLSINSLPKRLIGRVARHIAQLTADHERFVGLQSKLEQAEDKLKQAESRLAQMDDKLQQVDSKVEQVARQSDQIALRLNDLNEAVKALATQVVVARQPLVSEHLAQLSKSPAIYAPHAAEEVSRMVAGLEIYYGRLAHTHVFPPAAPVDSAYSDDDGTVGYLKRKNIYIPGNEVEIESSRVPVPWNSLFSDEKCGVFLIVGQSNAANHGDGFHRSRHRVFSFDFMTLACYRAEDPMPGASGNGGSIWPRLGDLLIEREVFESVLFISVAFGGSFVTDWSTDTAVQQRLTIALSRLRKCLGMPFIPISAVLWQQGEAEANHTSMPAATYASHLRAVFAVMRQYGVFCPVFVARATHCEAGEHPFNNHAAIRDAQSSLADISLGILPGPDIDLIRGEGRSDDCHLSALGLQRAAELWAEAIAAHAHLLRKATAGDSVDLPRLAPAFAPRSTGPRYQDESSARPGGPERAADEYPT